MKNKAIILLAIGLYIGSLVRAQNVVESTDEAYEKPELNRVLIIPYQDNEHFSDADHEFAKFMNLNEQQIRSIFRRSITQMVFNYISKRRNSINLMLEQENGAQEDLQSFYNSTVYQMDKSTTAADRQKQKDTEAGRKFQLTRDRIFNKKKKTYEFIDGGKIRLHPPDTKYYKAVINNANLIPYMSEKYNARYFIMLTMFEVRTRYDHCIDLATKNYEREFGIHYSIYNYKGKHVTGDLFTIIYDSNSNDLNDILKEGIPMIARHIADKIP